MNAKESNNVGNKKTTVSASGEGYDSNTATTATPTLTRRDGDSVVSKKNIPQETQENKPDEQFKKKDLSSSLPDRGGFYFVFIFYIFPSPMQSPIAHQCTLFPLRSAPGIFQ